MLKMSWHRLSEGEIWEVWALECQLISNGCPLATEKRIKQGFNHMTAKLIKCNVNNKYSSSSAVKRAPECKRTEKNKKKTKQ